jgi:head-tail adaptor
MPQGLGSIIGSSVALANKRHRVDVLNPSGPPTSDDGEYVQDYATTGYAYAQIEPATPSRLERFTQAGNVATASHVITMDYRQDVTTKTRLDFYGRRFDVLGYASPNEFGVDLVLVCQERVA